jgi:ATP-dependent Lhr-like helicase
MSDSRASLVRMMPDAFPIFFSGRKPYEGQALVMPEVVRGHNVLFAAPTASGKTEAAVTPLYQRHLSLKRQGLSTIYVAPTKALVNDLYERLVGYLSTRNPGAIARYTGDRHELKAVSGVFCLLATPEALDSLQLRRPEALAGARAVIVDEIHLLHGQARGQQLRHVIDRIKQAAAPASSTRDGFHVVGMTATLEDMEGVARVWLGDGAKILTHGIARDVDLQFIEVDLDGSAPPESIRAKSLARWIDQVAAEKVLVFANSRNSAHALAANLHKELTGTRWPVHLHFGALAAPERERVEEEMKMQRYGICVATATLEIGIDIGDIDAVVLGDPPSSVSGFLQRIGRGNRRSGVCRVVAFRGSVDDELAIRALVDCGRRGDLDDVHEYDRPSVRFQQILSLCWRATRQDRPLTLASLATEAGAAEHVPVINDMIETGALREIGGALVPCDRLMDQADDGRIHTVIAGAQGSAVVDIRTGKSAMRDADPTSIGGAIFLGGSMRRLMAGVEGGSYLGDRADRYQPLARIRGTGSGLRASRNVIWGLARQKGFDPTRWRLEGTGLVTWGGEQFNTLLAALLFRQSPRCRFVASSESVNGPVSAIELSIDAIRELARQTERAGDLPLSVASKFTGSSRFLGELSSALSAEEKRRSLPWVPFHRWLDRLTGVDIVGSMPSDAVAGRLDQ